MSSERIVRLNLVDEKLCADVADQLEQAWCADDPYAAVASAIERLVPETRAGLIGWVGARGSESPRVLGDRHPEALQTFERGYANNGGWRRDLVYDPRRVDPLAEKAVDSHWIGRFAPQQFARVRERLFEPHGLASILRTTLYRRSRLVAVCGYVRYATSGPFSARDRSVYERVIPLLSDGLKAVSCIQHGKAPARDLAHLLDAIPLPSFLRSSSGRVVHVNPAARRTFPQRPGWLVPRRDPAKLPPWVRAIPLRVGGQRFEALLVDAFDIADEAAHLTPWAERWKLPPRYARVAALLLRGHADKEIAAITGLELSTVRTYVKRILSRTGTHSRAELIRAALKVTR